MPTKEKTKIEKSEKYIEAVGRRKTATARVRITPASKNSFKINNQDLATYFPTEELRKIVEEGMEIVKKEYFIISVVVKGGGIHSQAEAVRHGIARAIVKYNQQLKTTIKKNGLLIRDSRMKERRKFGLKKARKAPQWSKR